MLLVVKKQTRILHAASTVKHRIGVIQQMQWEQCAAQALKLPWKTQLYCPKNLVRTDFSCIKESSCVVAEESGGSLRELYAWLKLQKEFYRWLSHEIEHYDILLLRYSIHDPFLSPFLHRTRIPTLLIHHTLETHELAVSLNPTSILRIWAEKMMARSSLRAASGIIGVTQEILNYEIVRRNGSDIPTTVYPNGIYYEKDPADDCRTDVPELVMVASRFQIWHGLDLLLDSIESCIKSFKINLIGELTTAQRNRVLNDDRIYVHNSLNHNQIKMFAANCWVGLSSFALHRNCMKQACTLKVREYLMMGLPVYANYKETLPDSFPYFRQGEANIEDILLFASEMRSVSRKSVAEGAEPYISKTALLTELYSWLLTNHDALQQNHSRFHLSKRT